MRTRSSSTTRGTRIFWVNQYAVPPDQPGGTRHYEMAAALSSEGYDVTLVASDLNLTSRNYTRRDGSRDRRVINEMIDGVPFVWLPAGSYERNDWRRALSMAVFSLYVLRFTVRHVGRGDVVIGSTPQLPAAAAARLAAFVRRAHFVLEVRDLWPETLIEVSGRESVLSHALGWLARALYRSSRAIVILAEGSRTTIEQQGGRPAHIVYIPNGVDTTAVNASDASKLPPDLTWMEGVPTFVYAGAHGPANGLHLVLDAARALLRRGRNDLRLLLVGDGPVKAELVARARAEGLSNVVFHDPIPKQQIPALLRAATGGLMVLEDVALFRYGVSPNKLFDYLAADLPVITNVQGEVGRIVEGAAAGVIVPSSDAERLASAIAEVADKASEFAPGSDYVRAHHDRRQLAGRLAEVLELVAERG
jgi:glycosyltransferase involved in cell wall biosynthesis